MKVEPPLIGYTRPAELDLWASNALRNVNCLLSISSDLHRAWRYLVLQTAEVRGASIEKLAGVSIAYHFTLSLFLTKYATKTMHYFVTFAIQYLKGPRIPWRITSLLNTANLT